MHTLVGAACAGAGGGTFPKTFVCVERSGAVGGGRNGVATNDNGSVVDVVVDVDVDVVVESDAEEEDVDADVVDETGAVDVDTDGEVGPAVLVSVEVEGADEEEVETAAEVEGADEEVEVEVDEVDEDEEDEEGVEVGGGGMTGGGTKLYRGGPLRFAGTWKLMRPQCSRNECTLQWKNTKRNIRYLLSITNL